MLNSCIPKTFYNQETGVLFIHFASKTLILLRLTLINWVLVQYKEIYKIANLWEDWEKYRVIICNAR